MARTQLEKILIAVVVVCTILVLITTGLLSFGAYYVYVKNPDLLKEKSDDKMSAAVTILSHMNEDVNPCQNFYDFVCGRYSQNHPLPEDRSSVSLFSDTEDILYRKLKYIMEKPLTDKAQNFFKIPKTLYDSCMDLQHIETLNSEPLIEKLKYLGGWPVTHGEQWNETSFDWIETLIKFRKLGYSHNILFSTIVVADERDSSRFTIRIAEPLVDPLGKPMDSDSLTEKVAEAYLEMMKTAARKLGSNEEVIQEDIIKTYEFETELASLLSLNKKSQSSDDLVKKFTLKSLKEFIPEINWEEYLQGILNAQIEEDESVIVSSPMFLKNLSLLINTTDYRTLANYLLWRVVEVSMPRLSQEWRTIAFEFDKLKMGKERQEPRWEICLKSVMNSLPIAISSLYVKKYFKDEKKKATMDIVDEIRNQLTKDIEKLNWMGRKTRRRALTKVKNMRIHIGYTPELLNDNMMDEIHKDLTLMKENYYENTLRLRVWQTENMVKQFGTQNVKGHWKTHAVVAVANAFYNPVDNSMDIPAGILQNWFYSKNRPMYLNFGAIGFVIGHEMTHGFDQIGRLFDEDGNNANWWDKETDEYFNLKVKCFVDQYSNYTLSDINTKINGRNTLGGNIADNGGITEAYKAYLSWRETNGEEPILPGLNYTAQQLFWISAANVWCEHSNPQHLKLKIENDNHSPAQFRVIGSFSNNLEFSSDFDCPVGSPMNPKNKCHIW